MSHLAILVTVIWLAVLALMIRNHNRKARNARIEQRMGDWLEG